MTDKVLIALTTDIISAFVQKNAIPPEQLPALIQAVHGALGAPTVEAAPAPVAKSLSPAQIRKSITDEALISFEDGRPYRMLKRHLTTHGLTPAEYRSKWGLPADYPMVAPAYAALRSEFAKSTGLGSRTRGRRAG
jgi:predicted transcriptional regulator